MVFELRMERLRAWRPTCASSAGMARTGHGDPPARRLKVLILRADGSILSASGPVVPIILRRADAALSPRRRPKNVHPPRLAVAPSAPAKVSG